MPSQCPERGRSPEMWAYKILKTKHFHEVSSGNQHSYLLKSQYGKVRFVPRYNNDAENLFKQLNLLLNSWNMFRTKRNAENYLSAWALARRFTKFTDCKRGMNKLKNGKVSILQILDRLNTCSSPSVLCTVGFCFDDPLCKRKVRHQLF
jgi:hypothetical protein